MVNRLLLQPLWLVSFFVLASSQAAWGQAAKEKRNDVKRGEYLAKMGGCSDCHSPKIMTPAGPVPDPARALSGFPAGTPLPPVPAGALGPGQWGAITTPDLTAWVGPWGTSFAANITPDKVTGIGAWTAEQFAQTMRTGKHLGVGRPVLPPMPWQSVAVLSPPDMQALFAYLQSIPPIVNQVPAPIPPK
jgi:hypothetical protein